MLVLTIRTDKPEAEIGLYDGEKQLVYYSWLAHRQLSVDIHQTILDVLRGQDKKLADVQGIVGFAGPGSFTGLRIGLTVANALAYGLAIPIVASTGDAWRQSGITRLQAGEREAVALPEYGALAHITTQKK